MNTLEKVLGPISAKISANKYIKALSGGMIATMPIMLGTSLIAILSNLPIPGWLDFLKSIGIYDVAQDFVALTLSLLAIYVVITISYNYTKNAGKNSITGVILSTASFLALIPRYAVVGEAKVAALQTSYLGSDGIFVAMIVGLVVSASYCWLSDKKLVIKLPDSVPANVSASLAPTFVAMIIFTVIFLAKYLFTLTAYGNVFGMINQIVAGPVMLLGSSPWAIIIFYCFANFCWFFGIHPGALTSLYVPILYTAKLQNIEAFTNGDPLPHLVFYIVGLCVYMGGHGNTLGLCFSTLFAKSEKYKALRKLIIIPNLFNINEPVIFGIPVMLNPLYLIPMVFSPLLAGSATMLLLRFLSVNLNPTVAMPWVTPGIITAVLQGGLTFLIVYLVAFCMHVLIYYPFFRVDDQREYKLEQTARESGN